MKTIPMIFNTEMVKALLDGRKTVTRRLMKPQPEDSGRGYKWIPSKIHQSMLRVSNIDELEEYKKQWLKDMISEACPFGNIGDLIWVRETFGVVSHMVNGNGDSCDYIPDRPSREVMEMKIGQGYHTGDVIYRSDGEFDWVDDYGEEVSSWKPSIHMPRLASRLTLRVTDVRIEQVQDITEEQAILEGMPTDEECQRMAVESGLSWYQKPTVWFKNLWNSIYSNWNENPYVWVIEFEVIHKNVDEVD